MKGELKILAIGDIHFKQNNVVESEALIQELIQKTKQLHPDIVVFLGDILDRHDVVNLHPFNRAIRLFDTISQNFPIYIIIGNHDISTNTDFLSSINIFTPLKKWNNVHVVDQPLYQSIHDVNLFFIPYVPNGKFEEGLRLLPQYFELSNRNIESIKDEKPQKVELIKDEKPQDVEPVRDEKSQKVEPMRDEKPQKVELIKDEKPQDVESITKEKPQSKNNTPQLCHNIEKSKNMKKTIIFCHQEFRNAMIGSIKSTNGDIWDENNILIVSGHIHQYQRLQSNIIYTGSCMQANFGEEDDKTISLITYQIHSIENLDEYPIFKEERISLNLIKKITVNLNVNQVVNWIPPSNKIIRLIIKGTLAEIKSITNTYYIKDLENKGIKIVYKFVKDVVPNENLQTKGISYLERLLNIIKGDMDQIHWFQQFIKH